MPAFGASSAAAAALACGCEAFCSACPVGVLAVGALAAAGVGLGACGRTVGGAGFLAAVEPGAVGVLAWGFTGAGMGLERVVVWGCTVRGIGFFAAGAGALVGVETTGFLVGRAVVVVVLVDMIPVVVEVYGRQIF